MKTRMVTLVLLAAVLVPASGPAVRRAAASTRPNVVILMSDDQRWDMVTPAFTPNIYSRLVAGNPYAFTDSFVPNPLCCPSRTSTLTGNFSHTTGVWSNSGPYGGFTAFHDQSTIAVDFHQAGYRTAMIGKYLNGYVGGTNRYVPPGWDTWFALSGGTYYNYGVTTSGQVLHFGSGPDDYSTRVVEAQAKTFVDSSVADKVPFFMYLAFNAPHNPAIPDPLDVGRFASVTPADTGTPMVNKAMLESAYGVDRAVGELLDALPPNTIVVYMSDNGFLWGEHGLSGKLYPYNESIRIPMILKSLDGSYVPPVGTNDLVLNVDLRPTLTRAAGIAPLTSTEGIDWGGGTYVPRTAFPLERYRQAGSVQSYCGVREAGWMYTRYGAGTELLFNETADPLEQTKLSPSAYPVDYARLRQEAQDLCKPPPPGYSWGAAARPPYQPDGMIRSSSSFIYAGSNIYNTTGIGQSTAKTIAVGGTATYYVKLQNDGALYDVIKIQGCAGAPGFTVSYKVGLSDATTQIVAGTYQTASLRLGSSKTITARIVASSAEAQGKTLACSISATSTGDASKTDVVSATTAVI